MYKYSCSLTILACGDDEGNGAFSLSKNIELSLPPFIGLSIQLDLSDHVVIKKVEDVCVAENSNEIELYLESEFSEETRNHSEFIKIYQDHGWEYEIVDKEAIQEGGIKI